MKYFYDTEFDEDGTTIDFISIGIVANDGREYYAVNGDMDLEKISKNVWVQNNVMQQLPDRELWKPKAQIATEVFEFLTAKGTPELWAWYASYDHVVLAQLWGKMINMPKGIPMYTHDLRSYIDFVGHGKGLPKQMDGHHDALADARHLKVMHDYVKMENGDKKQWDQSKEFKGW